MKFKLILISIITCFNCNQITLHLASEKEEPIKVDDVKYILEDVKQLEKSFDDQYYTNEITKIPYNLTESNPIPLNRSQLKEETKFNQQVVAILVNRKILNWKNNDLFDYKDQPCSKGMLNDFIQRLTLVLNYKFKESQNLTLNLTKDESNTKPKSEVKEEQNDKKASLITAENVGIAVALISSLGTFMWGYREYKLHQGEIAKNEDLITKMKSYTKYDDIPPDIKLKLKASFPTEMMDAKKSTTNFDNLKKAVLKPQAGDSILNFNSAKNGKFVYAPILFATAIGMLGIATYQIIQKVKKDDDDK